MRGTTGLAIGFAIAALFIFQFLAFCSLRLVYARDLDGRYANSPLKPWFDQLASKKGLCCSFADGVKIENVDWDTQEACENVAKTVECGTHYRVRLDGEWIVVPDSALITEPNRFGPAVVWPYRDADGFTQIRCFMPGAGT